MSCLLPQFKWYPDTFIVTFTTHHHSSYAKSREIINFPTQCILSTTSSTSTTTVLDIEKLKLQSLEANSNLHSQERPWRFPISTEKTSVLDIEKLNLSSLETQFLTSEEAVIATKAAEAVSLAKAALKLAKEAASTVNENSIKTVSNNLLNYPLPETDDVGPTHEELELLQAQLEESISVKSNRQTERKAKRTRAAEKAASNIVTVKSGSTNRKKNPSSQEIDYNDPLRYLRGTTTSSKLLTAAEEQKLSAGIQDLLKLERLEDELTERYGGQPTIAQWAGAAKVDQKTLRERLHYGTLCKDKMIKSNIRLVISIAKNYQGAGMNLPDLVQEGCRGLIRGAEKFDASKGFKFSTYAHWWIKQSVRKSLSDQSRMIRLPFHMVEATYRVKEARKHLFTENGKYPNDEEIAEVTGLSMKRLSAVMLTPKPPRSLDQKIGIDQNLKPSDIISDPEAETSEDLLIKQYMREDLEKVLNSLNPREKQVVRWRFGLEDGRMKTLQEIGELMGVSRERIRQIESCAFRKLKNKKRTKHLQQYVIS